MSQRQDDRPLRISPWTACPGCNAPIALEPEHFLSYFDRQPLNCPHCSRSLNWWEVILDAIKRHFMLLGAFQVLGAQTVAFSALLRVGEATKLDLDEQGAPPDATIVSINMTANGPIIPLLAVGNTIRQAPLPHVLHLRGFPVQSHSSATEGQLVVTATWIAPNENEISLKYLADAATAYDARLYRDVVIPANIGVEAALSQAFGRIILPHCDGTPKDAERRAEEVLVDGATYGFQLNPFLSIAASLLKASPLDPHIRELLGDLRKYRNDLAHTGRLRDKRRPVDKDRAAEFLAAALFGFHYARYLDSKSVFKKRPWRGGAA